MSANFYELLKYAATGIASPDMTYYDKMRASTLMGGVVKTLTGQPPLTFKADGTPLISWSMKGNGEQTGTPSPQSIIMPTFCGVRTGNIISEIISDKAIDASGTIYTNTNFIVISASVSQNEDYTFSLDSGLSDTTCRIHAYNGDTWIEQLKASNISLAPFTVTTPSGTTKLMISVTNGAASKRPMIVSGSTAPTTYEPYGWAEKITCGGETTPVYLGEVPTVRRVKKVVFDGTEKFWEKSISRAGCFAARDLGIGVTEKTIYCTHAIGVITASELASNNTCYIGRDFNLWLDLFDVQTTTEQFKAYLASEYQAGHPVTVWYVLATEQTGIVNDPLCKIGNYADELHSEDAGVSIPTAKGQNTLTVDTPIQPSEMTITFKG